MDIRRFIMDAKESEFKPIDIKVEPDFWDHLIGLITPEKAGLTGEANNK